MVRCFLERVYVHFFGTHQRNEPKEIRIPLRGTLEFALTAERRHHASMNGKHLVHKGERPLVDPPKFVRFLSVGD